ncbi:hypothetical protein I8752_33740 [Nostocaceae cyanobacterium CENA369]|uniref:Uncharacterized protein n=1 Tax=Dendronalium phyllosphericum CENA369 TaxID=1725256 RepID=A0A8J7LPC5_9NOST|nr:hypothetical protein [Dendronalium phyllosphericum]MBH8577839.1 hypothetical protein [Dendronalium phyllosphericum CENA369]
MNGISTISVINDQYCREKVSRQTVSSGIRDFQINKYPIAVEAVEAGGEESGKNWIVYFWELPKAEKE